MDIRLWRLRKAGQHADAQLIDRGAAGCEVRFLYNGEVVYRREWDTRALAAADASRKRAELEREGWTHHW